MFVFRVYRYRLYPSGSQAEALDAQLVACCALYNAALEQRRRAWREHAISVTYGDQSAELRNLRAAGLLPAEANFWCQQAVLRRLDRTFQAFFARVARGEKPGYPRFKSARRFDTLAWTLKGNAGGVQITPHRRLRLQGVGAIKVKWHRELPADAVLGQVTVTRSSDGHRWHVCFHAELPDSPVEHARAGRAAVGVDLGVRRLVSLSTGEQFPGPRPARRNRAGVRRAARKVTRRKRGSKRRQKAAALLARHREREASRRRDCAHKLSRELVDRFDLIAVEDLQIGKMIRSARRTVESPGNGVAQKRGLNREITDQGWAQLRTLLAYKAAEAGRQLIKVDPANTSRTCAECGAVDARSRRSEQFRCVDCGHTDDADVNAARVILDRALAQQGISRPGRGRQAPTDALAAVA
jgi:putative transposase